MRDRANGQGSNAVALRHFNERVILASPRRLGEASKADLARRAGLTLNTAGQIVHELERQRLVRTVGKRAGQPATLLRLGEKGARAIGISLAGKRAREAAPVSSPAGRTTSGGQLALQLHSLLQV